MNLIKNSLSVISILTVICSAVVFAVDTVSLSPSVVTISPWDDIIVTPVISWAVGTTTYVWSIDWTTIWSQTWSTLMLDWITYVWLFPLDATSNATRTIQLTVTDTSNSLSWTNSLVIEQPMSVSGSQSITFWWDNYCGDWDLKVTLWEECDDWNGKNWDWCTINCECERWFDCLLSGLIVELEPEWDQGDTIYDNEEEWENWSIDNEESQNNENEEDEDAIPLKEMLKERNRTPLDLGWWENVMSPLETPSSWADWRLIGVYAEENITIDISTTLPTRASWHVAKPVYLPMTWWVDTWRPHRITIS